MPKPECAPGSRIQIGSGVWSYIGAQIGIWGGGFVELCMCTIVIMNQLNLGKLWTERYLYTNWAVKQRRGTPEAGV